MASTAMQQLCKYGNWKIVFDETFTSAKKVKKFVRAEAFKNNENLRKGKAKGKKPPNENARKRESQQLIMLQLSTSVWTDFRQPIL